jgi:hypothetical protein
MIYDSTIFTGDSTISGCSSIDLHTDNYSLLNKGVAGTQGDFYYDRNISLEDRRFQLSLNGQTLLQEDPIIEQAINEILYKINTGDFFIKNLEADPFQRSKLFFDGTTPENSFSEISYNLVSGSGIIVATGDYGQSLKDSIVNSVGSVIFTDCDYFLNGQKVYSGVGVGCSVATDGLSFIPLFGGVGAEAANVGGIVTPYNKNEFKYTAYKKRFRSDSVTGQNPDIFGSGFIEKRTNYYINGVSEFQSNYLELYTGVTIVRTGVSALISGSIEGKSFKVTTKKEEIIL